MNPIHIYRTILHAEHGGLLAELGRIQFGADNQQRYAALQQPCLRGAGGDLGASLPK